MPLQEKLLHGHFIGLRESASEWANIIIEETDKNMPIRCGHEDDLIKSGFDAVTETKRLTDYWLAAIEEQK